MHYQASKNLWEEATQRGTWNKLLAWPAYFGFSNLIGPSLVMRREMKKATMVVSTRVHGKAPRKGTQRVPERIATSTLTLQKMKPDHNSCFEIPVDVSDRMAEQLG